MARLPRVVVVDIPHHITQRGNARQLVFAADADRLAYLQLLQHYAGLHYLSLLGYCLMSNHVHLVAVPRAVDALGQALKHAHGRYASYWNARQSSSGHVWQGRFYSCPLDEAHLWAALRYTELNPVRAGMVAAAEQWPWSSARAHCDGSGGAEWLDMHTWRQHWSAAEWQAYLLQGESPEVVAALRQCTHTGRPLGTKTFVKDVERSTARCLIPQKGGRPRKAALATQSDLTFVA